MRSRRLVGAFVHLLLLHLLLVGSGDACVLPAVADAAHGRTAAASSGSAGMAGMAMPHRSGTSSGEKCGSPGGTPANHELPAPACQSMAPCAPAALAASPATVERPPMAIGAGPASAIVLPPASRTNAPEPPPPRA